MEKPADVNAHEPGGALPATIATPSPSETIVGIELSSATERATIAEVEVSVLSRTRARTLARDAASKRSERMVKARWKSPPCEGERGRETLPRTGREKQRQCTVGGSPLRRLLSPWWAQLLGTLMGSSLKNPGGRSHWEEILESKRPFEVSNSLLLAHRGQCRRQQEHLAALYPVSRQHHR